MPELWVANTTKQTHVLTYRVPEHVSPKQQPVPPGEQVMIWKDAPETVLRGIIEPHEKLYGVVDSAAAHRVPQFVGLCYSIGKRVDPEIISGRVEMNDEVLNERGRQMRLEAAVALANQADQTSNVRVSNLTQDTSEVDTRGNPVTTGLQERIEVVPPDAQAGPKPEITPTRGGFRPPAPPPRQGKRGRRN